MHLFYDASNLLLTAISIGLLVMKAYAFVDCLRRPAGAFVAFSKLTKPIWLAITGAAALLQFLSNNPIGLLSIAGTVAAIVYLVDVKPAVAGS